MRVHPTQLVEGCVLLQDVKGKSGRPIMKQSTVLTDKHITVLHKFFIESVEVSSQLENGETFHPKPLEDDKVLIKEKTKAIYLEDEESRSFPVHYLEVVEFYKQAFLNWSNGVPIDLLKIRKVFIPLLERIEEVDIELFILHQYGSEEDYLYHHGVSVGLLAAFLGKELGYRKGEWIQIGLAGFLSDSGMTKVDRRILNKVGPLTKTQMEEVRNHPTYSYRMAENVTGLSRNAKLGILNHHERIDGSGYPLGLTENKINSYARIIAIVDTYHAMTSKRVYQDREPIYKAIEEILQEQYTKLDAKMVRTFVESLNKHAIGKTVRLTNKQLGKVVFVDEDHPTRPIVKLHDTDEIISLQSNPELDIDEMLIEEYNDI